MRVRMQPYPGAKLIVMYISRWNGRAAREKSFQDGAGVARSTEHDHQHACKRHTAGVYICLRLTRSACAGSG